MTVPSMPTPATNWALAPDPTNVFDARSVHVSRRDTGERRMQAAILKLAILDLQITAQGRGADALRDDAERWVRGVSDDEKWPFSFAKVCEEFGLDVGATRASLLAGRAVVPRARPRHRLKGGGRS